MSTRESFPPSTGVCPANGHFHGDGGNRTHASFPPSRPALTRGEQRLLDWLTRFDFTGKGCYPTRAELAERCGYTEEYVSALVKGLREKDYITVTKRRRPGCKYAHNVYRIHDWNPHVRRGICNLRRDFVARRAAREAEQRAAETAISRAPLSSSYVERTATASKGSCVQADPSFVASNALPGRSRLRASRDFEIRRSTVDQRRRPQHITVVPDLTCPRCQELAQELEETSERKDEIIHKLSLDNTMLAERVSGHAVALEVAGQKIRNLETSIARQARKAARSEQVEAVIEHWKKHRPKTKASSFPPGGRNWQTVEKALSLMAEDEDGPVRACCEAIDGLHIAPWEAYGKRYMRHGEGRTLRNRLEHALGDETRIERCRGIVRRVREDGADRAWELCLVAQATYDALTELTLEQLGERRRGTVEPGVERFTVEGIVTRADG